MSTLAYDIEYLQNVLICRATGGADDAQAYRRLRDVVLRSPIIGDIAPDFLRKCRSTDQFWEFIKNQSNNYSERREFIWEELRPIFDRIEGHDFAPPLENVSASLAKFDLENVHVIWTKALIRRKDDPEGAITLSRTLLESVCKHILDASKVAYKADADLPALYSSAAKNLNISPSQHSELIFKQILGGCTAVVEGLGALRNRLSDAHGKGKNPVKPAPRHAELAVNLAGSVAIFLTATWEARNESKSGETNP